MFVYKKVALIVREKSSSWKSCQHITSNLLSVYSSAFEDVEKKVFSLSSTFNRYDAGKLAFELHTWGADLIIWLDHSPNPTFLIDQLCEEYCEVIFSNRPKFLVHVFGDFVLDCLAWRDSSHSLKEWPVHFLSASDKQQKLVESFFKTSKNIFSTSPFPVDTSVFNLKNSLQNSQEIRKKLGIEEDEKVLLYTGRISYQKNIDTLVKIFELVSSLEDEKVKLLCVGPWDDILIPYFGKQGVCGSFFNYYSKAIGSLQSSNVIFVNSVNGEELVKFYQASDLFVSFSTYNDEDFGMSPAEALCSGLPCLLSDWAGYSSFANYSKKVELISVSHSTNRPNVQVGEAREKIKEHLTSTSIDFESRQKISEEARAHLSIESQSAKCRERVEKMLFGAVESLSPVFLDLCNHFKENPKSPFKDKIYQEIYEIY